MLARRRAVQGRRQGRERRPQAGRARRRAGGPRGCLSRAACRATAPGRRSEGRATAAGRGRGDDRRPRRHHRRGATSPAPRQRRHDAPRPRRTRHRPASELELDTEWISLSVENTFERDVSNRERLHDELRSMAIEVAEALQRRGQVARTVTTKLRYADFDLEPLGFAIVLCKSTPLKRDRRPRLQAARPRPERPASGAPGLLVGVGCFRSGGLPPACARDGLDKRGSRQPSCAIRFGGGDSGTVAREGGGAGRQDWEGPSVGGQPPPLSATE